VIIVFAVAIYWIKELKAAYLIPVTTCFEGVHHHTLWSCDHMF
jgi:hypothetical protein